MYKKQSRSAGTGNHERLPTSFILQHVLADNAPVCQHVLCTVHRCIYSLPRQPPCHNNINQRLPNMSSRLLLNGRRECVPRSAVPVPPSEGEQPSATPSDSGGKKNYKPPVRGFFSDDSKTHTSGSSSQVRRRYIGLPNEYARPAYSVGSDTGTDSSSQRGFNGTKTREAAWLTSQKLAIQNLGEHIEEATGYITALVKILDAVEDIFQRSTRLACLFGSHLIMRERWLRRWRIKCWSTRMVSVWH